MVVQRTLTPSIAVRLSGGQPLLDTASNHKVSEATNEYSSRA